MNKKLVKKLEGKLKKMKKEIEVHLDKFADKDAHIKGDYESRFPEYGTGKVEEAQEVSEYEERLSVEHEMEVDLVKINNALKKIEDDTYGICEKCGKSIDEKRLKVYPEAELCLDCLRKEKENKA